MNRRVFLTDVRAIVLLATLLLLASVLPVAGQQVGAAATRVPPPAGTVMVSSAFGARMHLAAADRVVVVFKPGVTAAEKAAAHAATGGTVLHEARYVNRQLVHVPAGATVEATRAAYAASPHVASADADYILKPALVPNDPFYSTQQHAPQLCGCEMAWDLTTGSAGVVLAICDTGTALSHPEFAGRIWQNPGEIAGNSIDDDGNGYVDDVNGWNTIEGNNDPQGNPTGADPFGENHGTHCAGIAAATGNNSTGIAGVAWQPQIMVVRCIEATGSPASFIMEGMDYAIANGADVLSLSIGGGYSPAWDATVDFAMANDVVLVVCAQNYDMEFTTDRSTWISPVCNDDTAYPPVQNRVIGVAATDQVDLKADFSNYSGAYNLVDVSAPGVDIFATFDARMGFGEYGLMSGTSMSTPVVAGECALLRSLNPGWVADQVIFGVRQAVEDIDGINPPYAGKLGTGRVNVAGALGYDPAPAAAGSPVFLDMPGDEGGAILGSWSRSRDDGRGWNDVERYDILFSAGGAMPSTVLASVPAGTTSFLHEPTDDTTDYYYQVVVYDLGGQSTASAVIGPVRSRDDTPPNDVEAVTARDRPRDGAVGGAILVRWSGYDPGPAGDLQEFHIYRAETEFDDVADATLVATVDGSLRGFVDTGLENFKQFYYAITALDEYPNESDIPGSVMAQAAPNYVHTYMGGQSMIAVGAEPLYTDPAELFDIAPEDLNFQRWSPGDRRYITYSSSPGSPLLQIAPGAGYFFQQLGTRDYDIPGRSAVAPGEDDVRLQVAPGWNQLGNPYQEKMPFTALKVVYEGQERPLDDPLVVSQRLIRNFGWRYNPLLRSYTLVSDPALFPPGSGIETEIPSGEGFFLFSFASLTLIMEQPGAVATATGGADTPQAGGWQVRISARTDQGADIDNLLGVGESQVGEVAEPPAGPSEVNLCFAAGTERPRAVDLRAPGEELAWDFTVRCPRPDAEVELTWPDLAQLPRRVRLLLTDLDSGARRYLRTTSRYTYNTGPAPGPRHFRVDAVDGARQLAVTGLSARPAGGAYQIVYSLSQPAAVDVEIRNIAGVPVCRVLDGRLQSVGENVATWSGLSAGGVSVPSGRYLVVVRATNPEDGQTVRRAATVQVGR